MFLSDEGPTLEMLGIRFQYRQYTAIFCVVISVKVQKNM